VSTIHSEIRVAPAGGEEGRVTGGARRGRAARVALRLLGPLIFGLLVWTSDLSAIAAVLLGAVAWMLAAAAGLNIVIIAIKAWRWRLLLRMQGVEYPFSRLVRYFAIGAGVAAWTPGRMGDFLRAVAVHREKDMGLGRAVSSVLADRLMDAAAMAVAALAGILLLPGIGPRQRMLIGAVAIAALAIAAWMLRRGGSSVRRGAGEVVGLLGAARRQVGAVVDGLSVLWRPAIILPCCVTAVVTLVTFLQGFLVARGLTIDVGFWRLAAALAAASIASLLPVSVAGIGTREATLMFLLAPVGIGLGRVLGFSVAFLAISNGSMALIGGIAWCLPGPRERPSVDGDPGMPYNTPPRVGG